jgi:hypothetical protein
LIAGAFPGLFTFPDLLNLDIRDLGFWAREAQRKVLYEKMHDLRMSRMAWAESGPVESEMSMYQGALAQLEGTAELRVTDAWDELKRRKRG